ncbi:hypothetical protein G6O67_001604 [Ophiocordyceps sinensis]|uniref:Uncharacterized protein n=1 Tax=Ophiocordyceps sinensis TaxID=72228 RepID=A0A8H4PXZ9_9HYPO|nr:hypothetical protein G6O67_001604 [Ophiocordyceps sinensis]
MAAGGVKAARTRTSTSNAMTASESGSIVVGSSHSRRRRRPLRRRPPGSLDRPPRDLLASNGEGQARDGGPDDGSNSRRPFYQARPRLLQHCLRHHQRSSTSPDRRTRSTKSNAPNPRSACSDGCPMDVTRADFEALPPTVQRKVSMLLFLSLPHRYPTVFSMISPPSSLQKGEMAQGQINKQKGGGRNEKKKKVP